MDRSLIFVLLGFGAFVISQGFGKRNLLENASFDIVGLKVDKVKPLHIDVNLKISISNPTNSQLEISEAYFDILSNGVRIGAIDWKGSRLIQRKAETVLSIPAKIGFVGAANVITDLIIGNQISALVKGSLNIEGVNVFIQRKL